MGDSTGDPQFKEYLAIVPTSLVLTQVTPFDSFAPPY